MRVAAADIGTNSTRLLVADVGSDGTVAEVERLLEITRLGEGVDASGTLGEVPMGRVTDALERYAERAPRARRRAHAGRRHERRARCRQPRRLPRARRRERLRAAPAAPASEEAATTFAGVCSRAPGESGVSADGTLIVDVGGGSTELVLGAAGGVAWSRSLQAGCVRMTERFLGEDVVDERERSPPAPARSPSCCRSCPARSSRRAQRVVAVAGTATTLAAIAHGGYDPDAVHGARITRAQVRELQERARRRMPLAERREVRACEPERAPVIVAGLVVLGCVLDRFGLGEALVSERDILHGAALLAAGGTACVTRSRWRGPVSTPSRSATPLSRPAPRITARSSSCR